MDLFTLPWRLGERIEKVKVEHKVLMYTNASWHVSSDSFLHLGLFCWTTLNLSKEKASSMKIISIRVKNKFWANGGVPIYLLMLLTWEAVPIKWPWLRWFCLPGLFSFSFDDDFVRRQASWGWSDVSYFPSLSAFCCLASRLLELVGLELSDACIWNVHFSYVKKLPFPLAKSNHVCWEQKNASGFCKKKTFFFESTQ